MTAPGLAESQSAPAARPRRGMSAAMREAVVDLCCRCPPRALVRWTGSAARLAAPWRTRGLQRLLAEFFAEIPNAPPVDIASLSREIFARDRMDQALSARTLRRGRPVGVGMVDHGCLPSLEVLRPADVPTIGFSWHLGPTYGLAVVFAELGVRTLGVMRDRTHEAATVTHEVNERVYTTGRPDARADALWQALRTLREGGSVTIAVDVPDGPQAPRVVCFGRPMRIPRGPLTLASLSGARVVPIVPRWFSDGRLTVHVGEPFDTTRVSRVDRAGFEQDLAEQVAAWHERYVLAHPEDLRERWLRLLLRGYRQAHTPRV